MRAEREKKKRRSEKRFTHESKKKPEKKSTQIKTKTRSLRRPQTTRVSLKSGYRRRKRDIERERNDAVFI